jgi:hypothetical protein
VTGRRADGHGGQTDTTKGNLFVTAVHFDLHSQDFYGLGPNSTLAGRAAYRQHETWFGVQGYSPLASVGNYPPREESTALPFLPSALSTAK